MLIEEGKYYHLYNRSNNKEIIFKEKRNYTYFLKKYHSYCDLLFKTVAYCLMPTHFHFLVYSKTSAIPTIRKNIGLLLSSYAKAINKRFERKGSLFQPHTKAKEITDESYLITLVSYIHQNPIRAQLVSHLGNWPYSSYQSLISLDREEWNKNEELSAFFPTQRDFQSYSEDLVNSIRQEFWV